MWGIGIALKPTHLDLFSGIGGFSLAAEACGFQTIGFSEINPYSSKVLEKHWPNIKNYGNIQNIKEGTIERVDLITGGFPCQPFSNAGGQRGDSDERHLWPEIVRLMRDIRPTFALFENVSGLLSISSGRVFNGILSDLSQIGYDCLWNLVPACAIGANHERDRLWIIAYANSVGLNENKFQEGNNYEVIEKRPCDVPRVFSKIKRSSLDIRGNDGISTKLHECRVKSLGNSIVPQVAEIFLKEIRKMI